MPSAINWSMVSYTGRPPATPNLSPPGSATATRSTPSREASTRAWWRPIMPRPIRPARRFAISRTSLCHGVYRGHEPVRALLGQRGVDRQREHLGRGLLGLRQVQVTLERREPVVRDRVVDAAAHAVLGAQRVREAVAVLGHPDRVLVVHMGRLVGHRRDADALQVRVQEGRVLLPLLG